MYATLLLISLLPLFGCKKATVTTSTKVQKIVSNEVPVEVLPQPTVESSMSRGQQFWMWFAEKKHQQLFDHSTPEMQGALNTEKWEQFGAQLAQQFGAELELEHEKVVPLGDIQLYQRTS